MRIENLNIIFYILSFIVALPVVIAAAVFFFKKQDFSFLVIKPNNYFDNLKFISLWVIITLIWIAFIFFKTYFETNNVFFFAYLSFFVLIYYIINLFCVSNKDLFLENQHFQGIMFFVFLINWLFLIIIINNYLLSFSYIIFLVGSLMLFLFITYLLNFINNYNSKIFYYFMIILSLINCYINFRSIFCIYFIWYSIITLFSLSIKQEENPIPVMGISSFKLGSFFMAFLYDLKIIKYHFLKEFKLMAALRQVLVASFFIYIIFKRININLLAFYFPEVEASSLSWSFYFLFLGMFFWVIYIRHYIIRFCNPIITLGTVNKCIGACAAASGGLWVIRDSILNSPNPINIPYITTAVQMGSWNHCCLNSEDHRCKNEWLQKFKTLPLPIYEVKSNWGNYYRVDKKTILERIAEAERTSTNNNKQSFFQNFLRKK